VVALILIRIWLLVISLEKALRFYATFAAPKLAAKNAAKGAGLIHLFWCLRHCAFGEGAPQNVARASQPRRRNEGLIWQVV
jgi:hypothetical protein